MNQYVKPKYVRLAIGREMAFPPEVSIPMSLVINSIDFEKWQNVVAKSLFRNLMIVLLKEFNFNTQDIAVATNISVSRVTKILASTRATLHKKTQSERATNKKLFVKNHALFNKSRLEAISEAKNKTLLENKDRKLSVLYAINRVCRSHEDILFFNKCLILFENNGIDIYSLDK